VVFQFWAEGEGAYDSEKKKLKTDVGFGFAIECPLIPPNLSQ